MKETTKIIKKLCDYWLDEEMRKFRGDNIGFGITLEDLQEAKKELQYLCPKCHNPYCLTYKDGTTSCEKEVKE